MRRENRDENQTKFETSSGIFDVIRRVFGADFVRIAGLVKCWYSTADTLVILC
jgi:hypothetical protein